MIKVFLSLIFFTNILFSCSLCAVYAPRTDVAIHIKADKELIKTAKVRWTFASAFAQELLSLYDMNLDMNLDDKELKVIENALMNYIEPINFLTSISYSPKIEKKSKKVDVTKYKMYYKNAVLYFEYEMKLNYKIVDKNKLHIKIHDDGAFFLIIFDNKSQLFNIPYKVHKEYKPNSITYTINAPNLMKNSEAKIVQKENVQEVQEKNKTEEKEEDLIKDLTKEDKKKELTLLEKYTKNIKKYLIEIEKGDNSFALLFLLLASFVYGLIHALGPGHGKALAFSYFSSQKSSFFQAFIISLATAFVHIVGAFILVVVSVFLLQSVLNNFIEDSISYLTTLCAVLIMILSLYILYRKLKKKSCSCCSCSTEPLSPNTFSTSNMKNVNFVQQTNNKPIINENKRKKQDLFFVLTAGLIPCPGTVLLFIYAFILQTYFSVILASIAISLGMGVVIFASSFLGLSLNKVSSKSHQITNFLEIFAPIFMFILGILLLLSVNI